MPAEADQPARHPDGLLQPRLLSSAVAYENPWMRVREDVFVQPDGTVGTYGVVEKTDFSVVIAEEPDGRFYLVEQFRYPLGRRAWELPMGTWPTGKSGSAEELARQELLEETGVTAQTWRRLGGRLHEASGFCSQGFEVFHATGLTQGQHNREASEIDMVAALVTDQQFRSMIADGSIVDAPTITAYAMYRLLG
jgi:8-oxo-dGTP pyrophosphatase MutT (NUDIX family)